MNDSRGSQNGSQRGMQWYVWLALLIVLGGSVLLVLMVQSAFSAPPAADQEKAKANIEQAFREQISPFLKKHCAECHGADLQEAEIAFHKYADSAAVAAD